MHTKCKPVVQWNSLFVLFQVAKPFLEAKTANKVKFGYADDANTNKMMNELFDMEVVESAFGGKDNADFDITKYAERMREDDKRVPSFWKMDATPLPVNSPLDSEVKREEDGQDHGAFVNESVLVKSS